MKEGISADETMIYWEGEPFIDRELIAFPVNTIYKIY